MANEQENHLRGFSFIDQEVRCSPLSPIPNRADCSAQQTTTTPSPNIPNNISEEALRSLPFISLFVGVDEAEPAKAVYALYDDNGPLLRFVHGDGTFVPREQVCCTKAFNDGSAGHQTQRNHMLVLMRMSAAHCLSCKDAQQLAGFRRAFPCKDAVYRTLTYLNDLKFGNLAICPALKGCPNDQALEGNPPEYFSIGATPKWNFDPSGLQAYPSRDYRIVETCYYDFTSKYRIKISMLDFMHASFCLAMLMKHGLVSFTKVGRNDLPINLKQIKPLPFDSEFKLPLETCAEWSADSFIARFELYRKTFSGRSGIAFERYPNPIAWLEAQLNYEQVMYMKTEPWRLKRNMNGELLDDSVVSWDSLKNARWELHGTYSGYPKVFQAVVCNIPEDLKM